MFSPTVFDIAAVAIAGAGLYTVHKSRRKGLSLPPGPLGWPIIGNLLDMPRAKNWLKFAQWGEEYGGIMSVTVAGQVIVVVNDPEIAKAMLEKKGNLYADRPHMPMAALAGWDKALSSARYGRALREYRKLIGRVIGTKKSMVKFQPQEEHQAAMFLKRVINDPKGLDQATRKTAGALILNLTYGYTIVEEGSDPLVDLADKAMSEFTDAATQGRWLVDSLPFLRHLPSFLPGTGFKQTAARYRETLRTLTEVPLKFVQDQLANGTASPSYAADLLKDENISDERMDDIKFSAMSFYAAGSDTTVSVVYAYFLAVSIYPEVQAKVHAEIDAVVGRDRLPGFSDRENLPYVQAVVLELYRWLPIVPIGVPHRSLAADVHEGYLIPEGSLVIANVWKFLHDPETYKDPFVFNPDRFLGPNPEQDPTAYCFGYGRRICPGNHLADASVFINVAMSAAALTATKPFDASGNVIEPVVDTSDGIITRPNHFECDVKPRHENILALVQQATS